MDAHLVALGHEGIDASILDQPDGNGVRFQIAGLEHRLGVHLQEILDLRIADDVQALGRCRQGRAGECEADEGGAHESFADKPKGGADAGHKTRRKIASLGGRQSSVSPGRADTQIGRAHV